MKRSNLEMIIYIAVTTIFINLWVLYGVFVDLDFSTILLFVPVHIILGALYGGLLIDWIEDRKRFKE